MTDEHHGLIGDRIRELRRYRGMPLKTLANLSDLSTGFLSMVENGHRIIDRRRHLVAVANALQVSVPELVGQPLAPVDPLHSAALASVPAMRSALVHIGFGAEHEPTRTVAQVRAEVARISQLRKDCDYAALGRVLPTLLLDLDALTRIGDEKERRDTLRLLVETAYCTTYTLKYLGFPDLAMRAADLCHGAAERLGEAAWRGLADFTRLHSLPPEGRDLAAEMAMHAVDRLASVDDPDVVQVRGMLHLTAALSSAVAVRPDDARSHLSEAAGLARRVGEGRFAHMYFGPTNVGFWTVAIAVEMGEGGRVIQIGESIRPELVDSASRKASFYADTGRGLAQTRRHDGEAVRFLQQAEALAPQRIRVSSAVRETVASILRRERRQAGGRALRGLAHRCGLA